MIEIQKNFSHNFKVNKKLLKQAIQLTLDTLEKPEMDITLRLTHDAEMRQLNQTFRGIARSTDVLAFNQETLDPETEQLYLGDIIISVERANQQAQEQGHSLDLETAFLAIHGTLHLLGFDHYEPEEKKEMWVIQEDIFQRLLKQTREETN